MNEDLKYMLIIEHQGGLESFPHDSKEAAQSAKKSHIAYIKGHGFVFEGSTGLWVLYNDQGWDQWQDVHVQDSAGNHWFAGDEPDVKALPPVDLLEIEMTVGEAPTRPDAHAIPFMQGWKHYAVLLKRKDEVLHLYHTQPGASAAPSVQEILTNMVDGWVGSEVPYEEWCKEFGHNPASVMAGYLFANLRKESDGLLRLFPEYSIQDLDAIVHRWGEVAPDDPAPARITNTVGHYQVEYMRVMQGKAHSFGPDYEADLRAKAGYPPIPTWDNAGRSQAAAYVLAYHHALWGYPEKAETPGHDPVEHLLANLIHWCDAHNQDFDEAVDVARAYYAEDNSEETAAP